MKRLAMVFGLAATMGCGGASYDPGRTLPVDSELKPHQPVSDEDVLGELGLEPEPEPKPEPEPTQTSAAQPDDSGSSARTGEDPGN